MTVNARTTPIAEGEAAPDFELPAAHGEGTVSLGKYRGRSPVLVTLFRGLYCHFCRLHVVQLGQVAELLQKRRSSAALRRLLEDALPVAEGRAGDSDEAAILREAMRDFDRATRIPARLAAERARLRSLARVAWAEAREGAATWAAARARASPTCRFTGPATG